MYRYWTPDGSHKPPSLVGKQTRDHALHVSPTMQSTGTLGLRDGVGEREGCDGDGVGVPEVDAVLLGVNLGNKASKGRTQKWMEPAHSWSKGRECIHVAAVIHATYD